jgi:hypothetical protein
MFIIINEEDLYAVATVSSLHGNYELNGTLDMKRLW